MSKSSKEKYLLSASEVDHVLSFMAYFDLTSRHVHLNLKLDHEICGNTFELA